jgi:hypothetical protein
MLGLPTFEQFEWMNLKNQNKTRSEEEGKTYELLSSVRRIPFFYRGIPFILCKEADGYGTNSILRCL